jgi:hypothetical protein
MGTTGFTDLVETLASALTARRPRLIIAEKPLEKCILVR